MTSGHRLTVALDGRHAEKLRSLAERTNVQEAALAGFLLATALDEADPDPRNVSGLLNGIAGAFERAQRGIEQARTGRTVPLDKL